MKNLERYIDHDVVDQNGDRIGTLHCLWSDHTGQPAYLGVQTSWLFGKTHVVPADAAQVNETSSTIRLPYTAEQVKNAPSYEATAEVDDRIEQEVRTHYGVRETPRQAPATARAPAGLAGNRHEQASIQLHEEQVKVGKRQVEVGSVRLRKIVRTETVNQPVEIQREEIVIERVPASGQPASGKAFENQDIYIPLRREEPVVQKESRVREEVKVSKKSQTERQNVSQQVRREELDVQDSGTTAGARATQRETARPSKRQSTRPSETHGSKAVFGIVRDHGQASRIVDQLKSGGFSRDDISVLMSDKSGTKDFAHEKNTKAPEGATAGAATGGLLGGALGWLAGVGALAIPGAGPFIAAGPIMAALGGGAIGAGAGGLVGALIGLGIPEYEAKRYEGKLREGNILISIHSDNSDETRRAKEILQREGADDVAATGEENVPAAERAR